MSLLDAANALDALAAGRVPDRTPVMAGALALDRLSRDDRDLVEARIALQLLTVSGPFESNQIGCGKAALLAAAVRRIAAEASAFASDRPHDFAVNRSGGGIERHDQIPVEEPGDH
jgi:hypothetical protein